MNVEAGISTGTRLEERSSVRIVAWFWKTMLSTRAPSGVFSALSRATSAHVLAHQ